MNVLFESRRSSRAVVADGFDRATFHRFLAESLFFGAFRLLVDVGVTSVVIAGEIGRSGLATQIAIDALVIDVELALDVVGILICELSHVRNFELTKLGPLSRIATAFLRIALAFVCHTGCHRLIGHLDP